MNGILKTSQNLTKCYSMINEWGWYCSFGSQTFYCCLKININNNFCDKDHKKLCFYFYNLQSKIQLQNNIAENIFKLSSLKVNDVIYILMFFVLFCLVLVILYMLTLSLVLFMRKWNFKQLKNTGFVFLV